MENDIINIPRPDLTARLDAILNESAAGALRIVWFTGENGQGKSHFIKQFLAGHKADFLVSYAQCSSPLGNQSTTVLKPHQPLKDVFEDLLTNQASSRRRLNLVKNISLTVLAIIPIVGELAYGVKEIRRDLHEYKSGHREVDFSSFVREYFADLVRISAEAPVVIVIDDIQWSDVPTIEALGHFVTDKANAQVPITIILAGRQDEINNVPELLSLYGHTTQNGLGTELSVPPFVQSQIKDYYNTRFPRQRIGPDLLLWLEQKTGGNPFFIESYVQHLLMEGILGEDGSLLGELENYRGLPAEIRLVTNWLMKSLPAEDLTTLLTASVLGYQFSLHELVHLTQRSTLDLIRVLRSIRTMHGICEPVGFRLINGRESTVYRFTQHAVHTALYNELTAEEKEALHRMTAQYLNELRLAKGDDPEAQNSIASALMLHSRLGHQPDLEYQSILMKAQFTPDDLNEDELLAQLRELSPAIGISYEDAERTYKQALRLAPITTHHAARERVLLSLPEEERQPDHLTQFVSRIVVMLRHGNPGEANILLEMYLNRTESAGHAAHPLVHILYALSSQMQGRELERSLDSFRDAAANETHPTYRTLAELGIVLFGDRSDDATTLATLKEALKYSGRHHRVVQALVAWLLATRFSGRAEFLAIMEQKPIPYRESDILISSYPKTAAILRR